MPNTVKTIVLTDEQKTYLNSLFKQSTLEVCIYQQAKILMYKSEGMRNEDVASKLDIGPDVVTHCLSKFKTDGIDVALHDNKDHGRKAEITDDDIT